MPDMIELGYSELEVRLAATFEMEYLIDKIYTSLGLPPPSKAPRKTAWDWLREPGVNLPEDKA